MGSDEQNLRKKKILSAFILIGLIAIVVFLIVKLFGSTISEMWRLVRHGDRDEIADYLAKNGEWHGLISLCIISILQVVSIFFPGMVIQIAGSLIYAWWKTFLACYIGFVVGNTLVFLFARGISGINELLPFDMNHNWLMDKINGANPGFVIGLACMIPGIPNGFIPYIAASSAVSAKTFTLAVAASSWLQILCNCICGHFIIRGQWGYLILAFALQILLIVWIAMNREKLLNYASKAIHRKPVKQE